MKKAGSFLVLIFTTVFFVILFSMGHEVVAEMQHDHSHMQHGTTNKEGISGNTEKMSENDLFKVSYKVEGEAVPINRIHSWKITVMTSEGVPVKHAKITVNSSMPEHGHGMPTKPEVTKDLGEGVYLVEGIKFSMPGFWVVEFTITADGISDMAEFYLDVIQ